MATRHGFFTFEPNLVTLSGLTVTAVTDQSGNGYDLANAGAPQYEQFSWNGHPAVVFDGTDDTLKQTTGLGGAMISGIDTPCTVVTVVQRLGAANCLWGCGDTASANPFFRGVLNRDNAEFRKRDAATGAGAGAGGIGGDFRSFAPHVVVWAHTGTACTIKIDDVLVFSGAMDVGDMGTMDTFALACLSRNTDSAFCACRYWCCDIYDALTAAEERDLYTLYSDKYILRPSRTCGDHFRRRI